MKKLKKLMSLIFFGLLFTPCFALADSIQIATTGNIKVDSEPPGFKAKKDWFGIFQSNGQTQLRKTQPSIVFNGTLYFSQISVSGKDTPLFIIRGLSALKQGEVLAASPESKQDLSLGESLKIQWKERQYDLMNSGIQSNGQMMDYKIVLAQGKQSQVLFLQKQVYEGDVGLKLIWAGDLDRDGLLDLVLDIQTDVNQANLILFLSSKAAPHDLLLRAASFFYHWC